MECYSFYCEGESGSDPEEAWVRFKEDLEYNTKWIRGYHYWGAAPELSTYIDFERNPDNKRYRVVARVIASEKEIDRLIKVDLKTIRCDELSTAVNLSLGWEDFYSIGCIPDIPEFTTSYKDENA